MKIFLICVLVLIPGLAVLTGCDPNNNARVYIEYDQVVNFPTYTLGGNSTTGPGLDGMFIQYKITKITNTGSEAKTFVFDKHNVLTVTSYKNTNEEPSGDNILLGNSLANNISVQPGQTLNNVGCIIKIARASNPQELFNTSALVDLMHKIKQSQPVTMKRRANDSNTAMVNTATSSVLQNFCGN